MPLHRVDISKDETTIGDFLAGKKVEKGQITTLLGCGGIVHFTRGGESSVVKDASDKVHSGDFVFVAEQCPTGQSQTVTTADIPVDFAFVVPGDSDDFGRNARSFMNRRPATRVVPGVITLDSILRAVQSGSQIDAPINDVVIVTHASAGGFLFLNLFDRDRDNQIDYAELDQYAGSSNKPEITKRILRDGAHVHIRGCNIGRVQPFLDKLKEAIGSHVTLTAPKFFDHFGFFSRDSTVSRFEALLYLFPVLSASSLTRDELIDRLKAAGFEDFDGKPIPNNWSTWVPQNIAQSGKTVHPCTNPIDPAMTIEREYKHRAPDARNPLFSYTIDLEEAPPSAKSGRIAILKEVLKDDELMKDSHPYPKYKWFGYDSLNDFVDGLDWTFTWNARTKTMSCAGTRHEYELRIPITDAKNNLLLNVLPGSGPKKFTRTDLPVTDSRFFGRA